MLIIDETINYFAMLDGRHGWTGWNGWDAIDEGSSKSKAEFDMRREWRQERIWALKSRARLYPWGVISLK